MKQYCQWLYFQDLLWNKVTTYLCAIFSVYITHIDRGWWPIVQTDVLRLSLLNPSYQAKGVETASCMDSFLLLTDLPLKVRQTMFSSLSKHCDCHALQKEALRAQISCCWRGTCVGQAVCLTCILQSKWQIVAQ